VSTEQSFAAEAASVVSVRFMVEADASAGLLSRLLQPFAKRDVIPDRMWSHRAGAGMHAEIAVHALAADLAHMIEGNLIQVVGVHSVTPVLGQTTADAAVKGGVASNGGPGKIAPGETALRAA
jgi:hypothetical protein